MRALLATAAVCFSFLAGGCASFTAPPYSADYPALDALKRNSAGKVNVGKGQPESSEDAVNKITLRGAPLRAEGTTFAGYVAQAMASDLKQIGLFDLASSRKIDLFLLKNDIDISGISEGQGVIEVRLTITDAERVVFQKNYAAQTKFASAFSGATAIPIGQAEYPNLVRALLADIYRDSNFIRALSAP